MIKAHSLYNLKQHLMENQVSRKVETMKTDDCSVYVILQRPTNPADPSHILYGSVVNCPSYFSAGLICSFKRN
jgi:hypothetical protein